MIYEVDTRILHINNVTIKLSYTESLLFNLLLNNEIVTYKTIRGRLYKSNLNMIKHRLFNRINKYVKIKTIRGYGLRLESEIYITWRGDL